MLDVTADLVLLQIPDRITRNRRAPVHGVHAPLGAHVGPSTTTPVAPVAPDRAPPAAVHEAQKDQETHEAQRRVVSQCQLINQLIFIVA